MNMPNLIPVNAGILTHSGQYFSFEEPESYKVRITDIAHGLSNECRFSGQCPAFYSVAQHSVLVVDLLDSHFGINDARVLFQGLMHDAHEAFLGDCTTPLKNLMPGYRELARRVQKHIMAEYRFDPTLDAVVRLADLMALRVEKESFFPNGDVWEVYATIDKPERWGQVIPEPPYAAKAAFMQVFENHAVRLGIL